MMNNTNREQSIEPQFKEKSGAIISLILGIVNVLILAIFSFYPYNYPFGEIVQGFSTKLMLRILLITVLIALIGLIFGIINLKTSKKRTAILGTILGIIGLLGSICLYAVEIISST